MKTGTTLPLRKLAPTLIALLWSTALASDAAAQQLNFSVQLPEALRTNQVVIAAETAQVDVGVQITGSPDTTVVHMGAAPFVGALGSMPNLYTVGGASLNFMRVNRDVYSEGPVLNVFTGIGGSTQNGPFGRRTTEELSTTFPEYSVGNANAWGFGTESLNPGSYNDVGAAFFGTIRLTAGTYYFNSLNTSATGKIDIDTSAGPVEIYVSQGITLLGTLSGDAPKILIAYDGTFPVYIGGNFNGTVLAPNAALTMAGGLWPTLRGSFFAQTVIMAPNVHIEHEPSEVFSPTRIAPPVQSKATQLAQGYDPGFLGCAPAIQLPPGGIQIDSNGDEHLAPLSYPATPSPCQASITTCDANDNPIQAPTEAELNADPGTGSQCDPIGSSADLAECPIDPATVTNLCSSGCQSDETCGTICLDVACTNTEARCGKHYESCTPLASEDRCETYHQCPDPDTVKTLLSADARTQLGPQLMALSPSATPTETVTPTPYASLSSACTIYGLGTSEAGEENSNPLSFGDKKWGVEFTPGFDIAVGKGGLGRPLEDGELNANALAGGTLDTYLMGNKINVLNAQGGVEVNKCGWKFVSTLELFGDSIASWDSNEGATTGLPPLGIDKETPIQNVKDCESLHDTRRDSARGLRHTNFLARTAIDYYNGNGLTDELCAKANHQLNGGWNCDQPPYAEDQSTSIMEGMKSHYHQEASAFNAIDTQWTGNEKELAANIKFPLFSIRQAYSLIAAETTIPLGPISLTLAIEAFGFWEIGGAIVAHASYGLGYGEFLNLDGDMSGIPIPAWPEEDITDRDLRLSIGPTVEPGAGLTALAYVGIGLGPVSVGIEGHVDVVTVSLPAAVFASLGRLTVENPRPEDPTWSGDPLPGFDYNQAREWKFNLSGKVGLQLGILNGRINLAARVNLWFWSKTWRFKLADFVGYNEYFPILEGSLGDPAMTATTFGTETSDVEFTFLPAGTTFRPLNPGAPAFPMPFDREQCNPLE